ncbi:hypothetical protein [Desulfobulbus elongatus]|uniref:hypothetical protein n=1 Tax=Desulfobulbus elongatus TaxID=53332 RepID=UPI000685E76F|nr:hypothetical protein [Desulfobulbus elongatus]
MIDVTIEGFDGVKQFHAVPWDPEEHGRDLYQRAIDGEFGEVAEYVPPVLTVEAKAAIATQAVHQHLDTQAQAFGYDDIKSACSYADEPAVPKFQAEGIAFRKWRSLVWEYYYAVLAAVAAGDRSEPTVEGLIAELPALDMLAS